MPTAIVEYDKTLPFIENREPDLEPDCYLRKDGVNAYKIISGRRPSEMLLVTKLRQEVKDWRNLQYPGATETTKELFRYWFNSDHLRNNEIFKYWFCQREALETLVYLFEVKKYEDIVDVVENYSEKTRSDLLGNAVEITEDKLGNRKVLRYFPELNQRGEQLLPPKGLLRYAFKMATGSGKTFVMALIIAWSYLNNVREKNDRYPNNFLIVAPNVIVYERLEKDFASNKIFNSYPIIPEAWKSSWSLKVKLRDEDKPLQRSDNLLLTNIHQLYESHEETWSPTNVIEAILGKSPQKDLSKPSLTLLQKIKSLSNLLVINDEAHHVHDPTLEWCKTLLAIHAALPKGLQLWLDFSATPKFQKGGMYFPWIVVDYPLAQAVEDRIVKTPLIVKKINKKDPENINSDNIVKKYGDWISAALDRWLVHKTVYETVGKKPVLFIMVEKNQYADKIAEAIIKQKSRWQLSSPEEILVIHTDSEGDVKTADIENLRKLAREVDEKDNPIKVIISVLMLREGWDVRNVTIVLGLRPFTSEAEILPEQAIGRGLRLLSDISPDHTQTLEVMGTEAFEQFVKGLEKEGVGINSSASPPTPIKIAPEKSRLPYDIIIPSTDFRYTRNYRKVAELDVSNIESLFSNNKLGEDRKIELRMSFVVTETEVHKTNITPMINLDGRELVSYITREIMKKARLTCDFSIIYPIAELYILKKCFETEISDIENHNLRLQLSDFSIQEAIIDLLAKKIGELTAEPKETVIEQKRIRLYDTEPFLWRRKRLRCQKTVFNFVTVYNKFEEEFAYFLNSCPDIERFSALANLFRVDYLGSNGALRLYFPDFVAVQRLRDKRIFWVIETKGREFADVPLKDEAIKRWCVDVTNGSKEVWKYVKVPQSVFDGVKRKCVNFSDILEELVNH